MCYDMIKVSYLVMRLSLCQIKSFNPPQMFFNVDVTINEKISTINRIYINISIDKCGDFGKRNAEETT